jgi:hypothetical protein
LNIKSIVSGLLIIGFTIAFGDDGDKDLHTVRIVIPKVALLDIESENTRNITLKMVAPQEAGDPLLSASDNRIWLNVTSIAESGNPRDITVRIDEPIDGIDLKVQSEAYTGTGFGNWGVPQGMLNLNTADQTLVSGIKSGETGDGAFNGYNIKYIAQSNDSDYSKIVGNSNKEIVVIYTLTH